MDSVEKLLTHIYNKAYMCQSLDRNKYAAPNEVFQSASTLLHQYRTPPSDRDQTAILEAWKFLNSEGRKRKVFDGLKGSVPEYVRDEFKKFVNI